MKVDYKMFLVSAILLFSGIKNTVPSYYLPQSMLLLQTVVVVIVIGIAYPYNYIKIKTGYLILAVMYMNYILIYF